MTDRAKTVISEEAVGAFLDGLSGYDLLCVSAAGLGLSEMLKVDTSTAMRLVGRALLGDTDRLLRYGILLDDRLSASEKIDELLKIANRARETN